MTAESVPLIWSRHTDYIGDAVMVRASGLLRIAEFDPEAIEIICKAYNMSPQARL